MQSTWKIVGPRTLAGVAALVGLAALSACEAGREPEEPDASARAGEAGSARVAVDPAVERRALASLDEELATVESRLDSLPGLILSVRGSLRRHLNDDHIARARALGIRPIADADPVDGLVGAGELVRLPDSTSHWIVRQLDQSLPYVTPDKKAALEELGDRFHARLEEAGLPPFRFEISSVLRTGDMHRSLQSRNPNASRKESSHEFGTTVDIAYNEFSPPAPEAWAPWRSALAGEDQAMQRLRRRVDAVALSRLDSLGTTYSDHLKGELGAVLQALQAEGRLWPLYERSQPVFHTTVASRAAAAPSSPATADREPGTGGG